MVKTFWDGWTDRQDPDGTITATTPTGLSYTTIPFSSLLFPHWNTTTPPPPRQHHAPGRTRPGRHLMMPTRRRTRAETRTARIITERRLNAAERALFAADQTRARHITKADTNPAPGHSAMPLHIPPRRPHPRLRRRPTTVLIHFRKTGSMGNDGVTAARGWWCDGFHTPALRGSVAAWRQANILASAMDHQRRTRRQKSPMDGRSNSSCRPRSRSCSSSRPTRIAGETFDHGAQNHHPGMRCNDLR